MARHQVSVQTQSSARTDCSILRHTSYSCGQLPPKSELPDGRLVLRPMPDNTLTFIMQLDTHCSRVHVSIAILTHFMDSPFWIIKSFCTYQYGQITDDNDDWRNQQCIVVSNLSTHVVFMVSAPDFSHTRLCCR